MPKIRTEQITSVSGESILASSFTLNAANGTYQAIGLSVTLPRAGTYLVTANVSGSMSATEVGAYIVAKFVNQTDTTDIDNSETFVVRSNISGVPNYQTAPMSNIITVTASKIIAIQAFRTAGTTYQGSSVMAQTYGRTRMSYLKIA